MARRKRWRWRITADQRPGGLLAPRRLSWDVLFPHRDERQRRLVAGAEAQALGHSGILSRSKNRDSTGDLQVFRASGGARVLLIRPPRTGFSADLRPFIQSNH